MGPEIVEDIVIVGAGIAGLTTALGLHRLGIRSLVLESAASLRMSGFALMTWPNAWKALDAVGIGDIIREQHVRLEGLVGSSTVTGSIMAHVSLLPGSKNERDEVRAMQRRRLLEALAKDLPPGTIRFNSKVDSIEEAGKFKLLHLADGVVIRAKALLGCDGLNSVVAKWMGIEKPSFSGRWAIRGSADYSSEHGFNRLFSLFLGNGFRAGLCPCDEKNMYWFTTYDPSSQKANDDIDIKANPGTKMKQFVLSNIGKIPEDFVSAIETTQLENIAATPLMLRKPWNIFWRDFSRGNVCLAGDALHPMTPDLGQGGCAALEDGVVLARCLAEALLKESKTEYSELKDEEEDKFNRIQKGLEKYAKERKWRIFELTVTAYVMAFIQQRDGTVLRFIREKFMPSFLADVLLKKTAFDCGKLDIS